LTNEKDKNFIPNHTEYNDSYTAFDFDSANQIKQFEYSLIINISIESIVDVNFNHWLEDILKSNQSFECFLKENKLKTTSQEVIMTGNPTERSITFYMNEDDEDSFERNGSEEKSGKLRPHFDKTLCKAGKKFSRDELL
jgi:hypothetical protein